MKKHAINLFFYLVCFYIQCRTVFRLAFTVPPAPGTPGYKEYLFGALAMSVGIGLMVVMPNLIIEYFHGNRSAKA